MKRTGQQNKAMHKFFSLLADALNSAGLDIKQTLKEDFEIPWNEHTVKELIWRPVQMAMYNIESTTNLDKMQVSDIYETINRQMASKHGVGVAFPSEELPEDRWR